MKNIPFQPLGKINNTSLEINLNHLPIPLRRVLAKKDPKFLIPYLPTICDMASSAEQRLI